MDKPNPFNPKESLCFPDHQHIHVHVLVGDKFVAENGYGITELCCHACAYGIYLLYNVDSVAEYANGHPSMKRMRQEFIEDHYACAEEEVVMDGFVHTKEEFTRVCPVERAHTITVNLY